MRSVDELNELYGESYYRSHLATGRDDLVYERNEHWLTFFAAVAENICRTLRPRTVLDAGCAMGFLVEALRANGVDAVGIDASKYAVDRAHESIAEHIRVGSLTDPVDGVFDLVTCIEVIEHLPPSETDRAIANLTSITDRILLSSTPADFSEPTHLNVQPPEFWAAKMAGFGFHRQLDYDASYLTPWAALYVRTDADAVGLVRAYERERWQLVQERDALRADALGRLVDQRSADAPPADELQELRERLRIALDFAHGADAERASMAARLRHVEYALAAAEARELEVAEMVAEIHAVADGDIRRLEALVDSRRFRWAWRLTAPRRWLDDRRGR